ncbi:hypothetical protein BH20GEM1_BH20GEM1_04870 [soil metagenome]
MNQAPTNRIRWIPTSAPSGTARTQSRMRADIAHAATPAATSPATIAGGGTGERASMPADPAATATAPQATTNA